MLATVMAAVAVAVELITVDQAAIIIVEWSDGRMGTPLLHIPFSVIPRPVRRTPHKGEY